MKPKYQSLWIIGLFVAIILFGGFIVIPNYIVMQRIQNEQELLPKLPSGSTYNFTNFTYGCNSTDCPSGFPAMKECENLTPEEVSYYDTWLIQCMEIEPLPILTPEPTPTPTPTPTPEPSLAREIANKTITMPNEDNVTIALYQNAEGETCIEFPIYFKQNHMFIQNYRHNLYCSGSGLYTTTEKVVDVYNNIVIRWSPGGMIYEELLAEKNRKITEEEFARSNPEWNLDCKENTCTLTNIYNQSQLRYKVQNITFIREGKGEFKI